MRIKEQKYFLPDGREITIKSAGPEDALKVKLHREATSAETHFMAREPEGGQLNLDKITEILGSIAESERDFMVCRRRRVDPEHRKDGRCRSCRVYFKFP